MFLDPHQTRRCSPRPTFRPLLRSGTSFFHLRLRSRSQARDSAGPLPPALVPARAQVRGRATGFLPRRLGPRVPAFSAGETLRVALPEPAGAARLPGGGTRGEIRPSCAESCGCTGTCGVAAAALIQAKGPALGLGRGLRQNRIQCPAPALRLPLALGVKAKVLAAQPAPPPAPRPRLLPPRNSSPGLPRARGGGARAPGGGRESGTRECGGGALEWERRGSEGEGGAREHGGGATERGGRARALGGGDGRPELGGGAMAGGGGP